MYTDSRHAGKWHNIPCSNTRAYVCEAPKSKLCMLLVRRLKQLVLGIKGGC